MDSSFMPDEPEVPPRFSKKRRAKKPYVVQGKMNLFRDWHTWGRYASLEAAQKALEDSRRKYAGLRGADFRLDPENPE